MPSLGGVSQGTQLYLHMGRITDSLGIFSDFLIYLLERLLRAQSLSFYHQVFNIVEMDNAPKFILETLLL